jgi:superfamily II DNA or RNA helicase
MTSETTSGHRVKIAFDRGTVEIAGLPDGFDHNELPDLVWDARSCSLRAPAYRLHAILGTLLRAGLEPQWETSSATPRAPFAAVTLRPYQQAALDAWELAGHRGVLVLPTGSGKTRVALAAIAKMKAATLCLVPTRILLHQWYDEVSKVYEGGVGRLGDGARRARPITVATYESAYRHMHRLGQVFQLLVVDEAHHFGNGQRDETLEMSVAPWRLGLTATPITSVTAQGNNRRLIGAEVYRLGMLDLVGGYLAELELCTLEVELDADERRRYDAETRTYRATLLAFLRSHPEASWADFSRAACRTEQGLRALAAFRRAQALAHYNRAKSRILERLLLRHRDNRCLVFTADNDAAYAIAQSHLVMPITCDIGRSERERAFELFRQGRLRALVSSRVLNEGLDLPDADVAIIVGGAHGAREHVQRIGRVLRPRNGKRAAVYELLSRNTSEVRRAQERRRGLDAPTSVERDPARSTPPGVSRRP